MGRLEQAVADAPESEVTSFREVAEVLGSGLSRVRAGLQNGTLTPADIQRGVTNSFESARQVLDDARSSEGSDSDIAVDAAAVADSGAVATAPTGPGSNGLNEAGQAARSRFQNITETVLARVSNIEGVDDAAAEAIGNAASAFESATARLDQALFNPETGDPIHRGTFQELYEDALSSLQSQLTDLIGGSETSESSAGTLYSSKMGVEGMKQGGFGLDVAG